MRPEERAILREIAEGAALHLTRRRVRDRRRGSPERDRIRERVYDRTYREGHAVELTERRRRAHQRRTLVTRMTKAILFRIGQQYPDILDEAVATVSGDLTPDERALLEGESDG